MFLPVGGPPSASDTQNMVTPYPPPTHTHTTYTFSYNLAVKEIIKMAGKEIETVKVFFF